jgi:hypothetical protein
MDRHDPTVEAAYIGRESPPLSGAGEARWAWIYYAATPLFYIADTFFGFNVRVAAFDAQPGLKLAYYVACLGCGAISYWRPAWSAAVTLVESSVNILTLILGIMLPIYALPDAVLSGAAATHPVTLERVSNFIIASTVWSVLFYRTLWRAPRAWR